MRPLDTIDLLEAWDLGRGRHPIDRALVVLAIASPERAWSELVALTIGQRDRLLLDVRAQAFGQRLDAVVNCERCGTALEFAVDVRDVVQPYTTHPGKDAGFRLPTSADFAGLVGLPRDEAPYALIDRCASEPPADEEAVDRVGDALLAADPQADLSFELTCVACRHRWTTALDILSFLWTEIEYAVRGVQREVHLLARAYGWTEREILTLDPARRALYLQMVQDA